LVVVVALGVVCGAIFGVPSAMAQSPWWHIRSEPEPTYFHGGLAKNEKQELKVNATGGDLLWFYSPTVGQAGHAVFPFNASRGEVQQGLEGVYGAGNVEVSGGTADTASGKVFGAVTIMGELTEGSPEVLVPAGGDLIGKFIVGQTVTGEDIPAGTTVLEANVGGNGGTVTLSQDAEASTSAGEPVMLTGAPSTTVENFTVTNGSFTVGQEVIGSGIAPGTKLEAIDLAAHTATLSKAPSESETPTTISSPLVPYVVTFVGVLHSKPVEPPLAAYLGRADLVRAPALQGEASVAELAKGRPDGEILITASNLGDAAASGATEPITLSDVLPPGFEAIAVHGLAAEGESAGQSEASECSLQEENGIPGPACSFTGTVPRFTSLTLRVDVDDVGASGHVSEQASISGGTGFTCHEVSPGSGKYANSDCVKEGGSGSFEREAIGPAPGAHVSRPIPLGQSTPFGIADYELVNEDEGGGPDTQAGSHPLQQTTTIVLNQTLREFTKTELPYETGVIEPAGIPKDVRPLWPAGLVGNPASLPQCPLTLFLRTECQPDTMVGVARPFYSLNQGVGPAPQAFLSGLWNLVPSPGEPARFGFTTINGPVYIDPSVRSGRDYGITVNSDNITQLIGFRSVEVTVFGTPGATAFAKLRGLGCLRESAGWSAASVAEVGGCSPLGESNPTAFLTLPTACAVNAVTGAPEALVSTVVGDSWLEPKSAAEQPQIAEPFTMSALDGCDALPFRPEIKAEPDVHAASTPSGLNVDIHVPQSETLQPEGLAQAEPRNMTVALPVGVALNPSSADGLQSCTADPGALATGALGSPGDQIGFQGLGEVSTEPGVTNQLFTGELPESIAAKVAVEDHETIEGHETPASEITLSPGQNFCPNGSKVGTATIKTPLLPATQPLTGSVYLAAQESNPFDSVFAMYIVAEDPVSGSLVKIAGKITLCGHTLEEIGGLACEAPGQIITTFENSPQVPFEDAEVHFFGGERAPLSTPAHCGTYTTTAAFTPWSAAPGEPPVIATSRFNIETGPKTLSQPNGGPCPGTPLPFSPTATGGARNVIAGAFSPFTATFSRSSGEQNMQSIEVKLPPGLSGILANVELCPEPQANLGECGPNSLIGEMTVSVGVGGDPYTDSGGKFYLTGPYNGTGACKVGEAGCAPFGITFEVPAKAGPFDLANTSNNHPPCDCVLVRGKIEINPITAAITITSNPPGTTDAIPTSIEGIPLEIQHVNAITTRNDFQFNPTSCDKMEFTGTIHSSEGASDQLGVPFQVTDCEALKFTPRFAVSTSGKTSKADGASLTATVTEPAGSLGTQANLTRVKVELPLQLPSRLKPTLQSACLAKVFEANPAACPVDSVVGHAVVHTQILPVPLEGPAYFVSHGGEAFPSLTMVLQGYGVTIELVGTTFISKAGITSTTFKTVPDQPFSSFQLTLPEGPHSALATNLPHEGRDMCGQKLTMPTEFIAQNGKAIYETTPISITGCKKPLTRAQKLEAALATCHKKHDKHKREACERTARKRYGPLKKVKKKGRS
jgi:hypothetical protein